MGIQKGGFKPDLHMRMDYIVHADMNVNWEEAIVQQYSNPEASHVRSLLVDSTQ